MLVVIFMMVGIVVTVMMVVIDSGGGCDVTLLDVARIDSLTNFANTQMVVCVPIKPRRWWENIKMDHGFKIKRTLGFLTSLIYFASNRHIVKALLKFWNSIRVVFKFKDFELTPTIEEIGGFIDLNYQGWEYYVWLSADMGEVGFSLQGQAIGYEDLEETKWAHSILINHFVIPPEMSEQVISGSLAHFGA
ncbi:hypothetical protein FXO38_04803 [Capsicum annuum]|nr:hypothetical protein FXO38_04803 [Capsicum annuum]